MRDKRKKADDLLINISDYLTEAGWDKSEEIMFWLIDPLTKVNHSSITALQIQLDRDLQKET